MKKFLAILLVLTLCLPLTVVFAEGAAAPRTDDIEVENGVSFHTQSFPIVDEPLTLRVVANVASLAKAYQDMPIIQQIERETGIRFEWDLIPSSDYGDKLAMILGTNDLPDLFWNASMSDADVMKYGKLGMITPIQDYVDDYMPTLKDILSRHPTLKSISYTADGNMYAPPSTTSLGFNDEETGQYFEIGAVYPLYGINKTWIDNLGLKFPETIDELHDVLVAFKEQDANGNGDPNDEIPFSFMNLFWTADLGGLFNAFHLGDSVGHRFVKDGQLMYTFTQPEYKEAVAYFRTWVEEGLCDEEAFTMDLSAYMAKAKRTPAPVGMFAWWEIPEMAGDNADQYVILPPMAGFDGETTYTLNEMPVGWRNSILTTAANKYPKITARLLDYLCQPEVSIQCQWGSIGETWEVDENGKFTQLPPPAGSSVGEMRERSAPMGCTIILPEHYGTFLDMEPRSQQRLQDIKDIFHPYFKSRETVYNPLPFTADELLVLSDLEPGIFAYANEKRSEWLYKGGIEGQWDEYIKTLNKMGLQELLAAYQSAYERSVNP